MGTDKKWRIRSRKGLSWRMACRLKLTLEDIRPVSHTKRQVIMCGFGTSGKTNYTPKWLQDLDISKYDDAWDDWQPEEVQTILDRVRNGYDAHVLKDVFRPPEQAFGQAVINSGQSARAVMLAIEDGFSVDDIENEAIRDRANQEWREYAANIDLSQPTNRSAVRNLIILRIRMRQIERLLLDPSLTASEISSTQRDYKTLMDSFSSAAEDVSQLERQKDNREQQHTFSMLVERTRQVRDDWRKNKVPLHMMLEEKGLIDNMVAQHKVSLRGVEERIVERKPRPEPRRIETMIDRVGTAQDPDDVVTGVLAQSD